AAASARICSASASSDLALRPLSLNTWTVLAMALTSSRPTAAGTTAPRSPDANAPIAEVSAWIGLLMLRAMAVDRIRPSARLTRATIAVIHRKVAVRALDALIWASEALA